MKEVKNSLFNPHDVTLPLEVVVGGGGGQKVTNVHFPGSEIDLVGFHLPLLWEQRTAQRGGKHQAKKRKKHKNVS